MSFLPNFTFTSVSSSSSIQGNLGSLILVRSDKLIDPLFFLTLFALGFSELFSRDFNFRPFSNSSLNLPECPVNSLVSYLADLLGFLSKSSLPSLALVPNIRCLSFLSCPNLVGSLSINLASYVGMGLLEGSCSRNLRYFSSSC